MAGGDLTVEILKDIRDELRGVRTEVHDTNLRLDATNQRLDTSNQRLNLVEAAILDLAEQHRFVVRYTKAIADRDGQLEPRVSSLESRVDKLESK